MTTFKFNFTNDNIDIENEDVKVISWHKCEEILPTIKKRELEARNKYAKMFIHGDVEIGHVSHDMQLKDMLGSDIDIAEKNHSDLITAKYEGGLKVWECTYDMIGYLEGHKEITFQDTRVLDLGCGIGILGIYALLNGGLVTFQDYNKEIIENITIPNVLLNMDEDDCTYSLDMCKFYCGDWKYFNEKLQENKFDIILTSETIYNIDNYEKLLNIFKERLCENGVVLIGAKTCYFGVGGGVREFEKAISCAGLISEVIWKNDSGIQREIIKVWKK